jgi:hypothetical protein
MYATVANSAYCQKSSVCHQANLVEQVGFGPAMKGCRGQHGILELLVLPAAECAFGQEAVPDPL